jgi:glycosyltransferase involved in cell wall biosynthesis
MGDSEPLLTVIVPVFNEKTTIDRLLAAVLDAPFSKQVVVVDDGSSDGSAELLEKWSERRAIEFLRHARNEGKGAAIRTALRYARGRFVVIQDADLEYDPQDYFRLIQPLLDGHAEVVYGSRRLGCRRAWRQWLNPYYHAVTLLNVCVRLLYGVRVTDEATCYKAFPTAALRSMDLTCQRFEFCPEVTAKACRMGLAIREVPIRYTSRRVRDGKKIGVSDAIEAVKTLWRWRTWQPVPAKCVGANGRPTSITGDANSAESHIVSGASEVRVTDTEVSRIR